MHKDSAFVMHKVIKQHKHQIAYPNTVWGACGDWCEMGNMGDQAPSSSSLNQFLSWVNSSVSRARGRSPVCAPLRNQRQLVILSLARRFDINHLKLARMGWLE